MRVLGQVDAMAARKADDSVAAKEESTVARSELSQAKSKAAVMVDYLGESVADAKALLLDYLRAF